MAVACGANMNFDRLRFVSERAEVGEQREAVFAVTIPEERGSFRRFCETGRRGATSPSSTTGSPTRHNAHVFVGMQVADRATTRRRSPQRFGAAGFATLDLTDDELAKLHLRHLVGGHSPLARNELLYRFEFPERPGALMRFLSSMSPNWNISLFHYRNHGADYGRILVGIQVPAAEMKDFREFLGVARLPALGREQAPGLQAVPGRAARLSGEEPPETASRARFAPPSNADSTKRVSGSDSNRRSTAGRSLPEDV